MCDVTTIAYSTIELCCQLTKQNFHLLATKYLTVENTAAVYCNSVEKLQSVANSITKTVWELRQHLDSINPLTCGTDCAAWLREYDIWIQGLKEEGLNVERLEKLKDACVENMPTTPKEMQDVFANIQDIFTRDVLSHVADSQALGFAFLGVVCLGTTIILAYQTEEMLLSTKKYLTEDVVRRLQRIKTDAIILDRFMAKLANGGDQLLQEELLNKALSRTHRTINSLQILRNDIESMDNKLKLQSTQHMMLGVASVAVGAVSGGIAYSSWTYLSALGKLSYSVAFGSTSISSLWNACSFVKCWKLSSVIAIQVESISAEIAKYNNHERVLTEKIDAMEGMSDVDEWVKL